MLCAPSERGQSKYNPCLRLFGICPPQKPQSSACGWLRSPRLAGRRGGRRGQAAATCSLRRVSCHLQGPTGHVPGPGHGAGGEERSPGERWVRSRGHAQGGHPNTGRGPPALVGLDDLQGLFQPKRFYVATSWSRLGSRRRKVCREPLRGKPARSFLNLQVSSSTE